MGAGIIRICIENQRKKLIEQCYLTDDEATELEELFVEDQNDYGYLLEAQKKKMEQIN